MNWRVPRRRRPEEFGGDMSNVSNRAAYRADLRQKEADRRASLIAKTVMLSVIGTFMAYLAWQIFR